MQTVVIIVPENVTSDELMGYFQKVINDLRKREEQATNEQTRPVYPAFIFGESLSSFNPIPTIDMEINRVCKNLISKLGDVVPGNQVVWSANFFKSFYNAADNDITREVIEFIANIDDSKRGLLRYYNLEFLIDICKSMCER